MRGLLGWGLCLGGATAAAFLAASLLLALAVEEDEAAHRERYRRFRARLREALRELATDETPAARSEG